MATAGVERAVTDTQNWNSDLCEAVPRDTRSSHSPPPITTATFVVNTSFLVSESLGAVTATMMHVSGATAPSLGELMTTHWAVRPLQVVPQSHQPSAVRLGLRNSWQHCEFPRLFHVQPTLVAVLAHTASPEAFAWYARAAVAVLALVVRV